MQSAPCLYYTIFERAFATRKSNLPLGGATTRLMSLPSFRVKARSYFDPIICYIAYPGISILALPGHFTFLWVVYRHTVVNFSFLSFQNKVPIVLDPTF